jgi:hypothetical protein
MSINIDLKRRDLLTRRRQSRRISMGLTQIQEGAVGWAPTMFANLAFLRLPPRFVSGLLVTYNSTTSLNVTSGVCRDDTDSVDMSFGPGGVGPGGACTAALGAGGNVDAGTHSYVVTFVTPLGEALASPVSNTITAVPSVVSLTAIPTSGGSVSARNIYRSKAGNDVTGPWLLLATISDNTATTYSDNTADSGLGTTAPIGSITLGNTDAGQNGLDTATAAGTVTQSGTTWTGSGTSFLSAWGSRGLPGGGTISTSGSSTTITGSSTRFRDDLAVNDLIGLSPTLTRITSINSDTSLTVSQAVTIAAGSTATVVEQPTFTTATDGSTNRVDQIQSNTTLLSTSSNTHATPRSFTVGTNVGSNWLYLHLVSGTAGTALIASTQRTTLLNPGSGYTSYKRRIGTVRTASGTALLFAFQKEVSPFVRDTFYEESAAANGTGALSGGGAVAFTSRATNTVCPPSARQAYVTMIFQAPTAQVNGYLRESSLGSSTTTRNLEASCANGGSSSVETLVDLDRSQNFDYVLSAAAGSVFAINVRGYRETL